MKNKYKIVFQTEIGKEVFKDILKRLGYGEPLSRITEREELKAVALYDFAVEIKRLVDGEEDERRTNKEG